MDYVNNAPLFICLLRAYLAARAGTSLRRLYRGIPQAHELREARVLLNCLQVLTALESRRQAALQLLPPAPTKSLTEQQALVISHALTLMDRQQLAGLPYQLSVQVFAHCGLVTPITGPRRVLGIGGKALRANYALVGLALPTLPAEPLTPLIP